MSELRKVEALYGTTQDGKVFVSATQWNQLIDERDQALATLRRLHAAAKIVTAYEWPQDASPMGAMDEFDAAMAEAATILNPSKKGDSTEQQ